MYQNSGHFCFRVDPLLRGDLRKKIDSILSQFKDAEVLDLNEKSNLSDRFVVELVSQGAQFSTNKKSHLRMMFQDYHQDLFNYQNDDETQADAVLDESVNISQLSLLLLPEFKQYLETKEALMSEIGLKNLKRLELRAKGLTQKILETQSDVTVESLLDYSQSLVDLERDLIQAEDLNKIEKNLRQFVKSQLQDSKFHFYKSVSHWKLKKMDGLIALPYYRGEFVAMELDVEEDDYYLLLQKVFFIQTVVSYFLSQQEVIDPFDDESLWQKALDIIPFPVSLLSEQGEVHQHNTHFARLNLSPEDCLKFKLKEKVSINNIPYNIYRKEVFHLDQKKILYVLFTESLFLKGDNNITPSGQELGIISSSIAHELNNPVAGIHAALSLLSLDAHGEEVSGTLQEMKSGAIRCKQLIETFLGFSRVNPINSQFKNQNQSTIEVCYQQAQNLLRFRTVESGIRFSFNYSRHTAFKEVINPSLLTMTFYLILGEMMTLYSHHLLVANKNQIEKVIRGELVESAQEIQIQLAELNISTLSHSKLVQNLIAIENFVLQSSDYSLRLIASPLKDV